MNISALLLLLLLCAALALGQKKPKATKKPTPTTEASTESSGITSSMGEENKHPLKMSTETNDGSTIIALASKTPEEATNETPTPAKEDKVFVATTMNKVGPHSSTTTDEWEELTKQRCSGIQCFDAVTLIIIIVAVIVGIFLIIISFVVGRKCCRGSSTQAKYSKIGEMYN